jgi:hypothetical protein
MAQTLDGFRVDIGNGRCGFKPAKGFRKKIAF